MSWSRRLWRTLPLALVIVLMAATAVFAGSAPTDVDVKQVTGFTAGVFPAYCGSGATVQVKFGYISNPDNPGTTEARILLLDSSNTEVGSTLWHTVADGDNRALADWQSLNVVTPAGAPNATKYKIVLQVANSNSSPSWVEVIRTPGLEVDLTGPGLVSGVYVEGGVPTGDSTPEFKWTEATDDRAGIRSYWVAVGHSATAPPGAAMTDTTSDGLSWTSGALADANNWYFHIRAQDKAFNYGDAVTFGPFTVDTVAPVLSKTSPITWANVIKPNVVITAVETGSGIDEGTTDFTLIGSSTGFIAGSWSWTGLVYTFVPTNDLNENESYTATMDVDDKAGNHAAQLEFTFQVDAQAPTISALTPANDTWVTTATPAISAKVEDETDGSGIASGTIVMKVDGVAVSPAYNPLTGEVSFTPGAALSDGTHAVTVDVKDVAGNAATQASWTFKVDTVAPVLSKTSPIDWANVIKPSVVITAVEATSGIDTTNTASTVFTLSGGAPVAGTGAWDPTGLVYTFVPDGDLNETDTYTATMDAKDNAGNSATQLTWTFQVDVQPPTIDNLAPANDTWVTTATPTISAQVHSEVGGSGIDATTIVMKVDGVTVSPDYSLPPTVSFMPAGLAAGTHTVTVDVKDVAGNAATQASWTFKVDTIKPTLSGTPLGWANVIKPNVVITAVEAGSGMNTGVGTFTLTGSTTGNIAGSGDWDGTGLVYTFVPTNDLNETETYTATMTGAADIAGNASDPSPLTFTFGVDVTKPTISALTPANDTWVTTATPTISAQVHSEGGGSGIDSATIVMKVDGVTVAHAYADPTVSFMPAGLAAGTHTVTVDVKDAAGNAATQASWTFKVDTIKPTLSGTPLGWATTIRPDVVITAVEAGSGMNTGVGTFELKGNISGPIGGSGSWDGTKLIYTWTPTNDLNETETYTATMTGAADVAGNASDPSPLTFTFQVDAQPPTISGLLPTDDTWVATGTPTIQATVQDVGSGIDESTIVMAVDGPTVAHAYASGTGVVSYIPSSALSEGAHTVTVDVSDNAGNAATQASWTFKVDTVDPVINEATWAGPWTHEPGHWTSNTSPTITVAAYDPGADDTPPKGSGIAAGTASAALSLNNVPITVLPGTVTFVDGKITVVLAGLADGEYELTVGIYDNVGNLATPKSVTFHVDATGPDFANPYPLNGYETNNRGLAPHIDITDAGVGVDPDNIAWTMTGLGGAVTGAKTWSDPTSTFKTDEQLTPDGQYTLTVSADDLLGNNSTYPSGTWSFLLDTTAPVLDGIELDLYRQIPYVDGVIYTPSKTPEVRVDFSDPAPASGFNGAVCDVAGTFYVFVYKDAAMTELVPGTLTRDATPSTSSDPWGGEWVPGDDLDDGDYFVKVVITDDAGNTRNPATYDFRFIVDTKPPDIDNSDSEVGFLNGNNNRRFANSRILEVKWDRTPDPEAESGVPGSGLLGYEFEIWTKAETDVAPIGEYLQYGYTDEDHFNGDWLDIVEPTGTETEVYTMRRPAGFESGKSYGAWLKAYDMLHNGSAWFDPPFIFDPDAPTDPGVPEVQDLKTGRRTNDSTPALKWAHSTDEKAVAQSGVDLYEVQITAAGTTTWDIHYEVDIPDEDVDKIDEDHALDPSGDPFEWTVPSKLEDGGYEVRVRAKDVAGNYSNWVKIAAPFTIDTQAPPVPGIPVPKATPTNIRKPEWTWASSAGAVSYNVYMDDKDPINVTTAVFTSGDYTDDLDEGTHHLRVTALDDLGNESAKSGTGHVVIDLTKPVAPVMFGIPPFINGNWDKTVTLIWTAREDAVEYEVAYEVGTASKTEIVAVQTLPLNLYTILNLSEMPIPDGTQIKAKVRARDAAGNWSDLSNEVSTTVDSKKPTVTRVAPIPSGRMKLTPTWTWSAQDGTGSQVSHYIVLLNGELLLETTSTSFKPASELDTGEYTLTVVAVDNVGNQSDPDVDAGRFPTVTIDKQAPAVPGMPTTTSPTNSQTPTWTWKHISDADLEKYNVYLDGSLKGSVGGPWSLGTTSITWLTPEDLGHGLHVLEVTSVDDLGNESARSTPGHVFVDLNAPAIPGAPIARENPTNKPTQRWDWSYVEGAARFEVQYQLKGAPGWTEPIDVGTDTTYETTFVGNGVIGFLRVRAFDVHGNVGNPGNPEGWSVVDEEEERGLVYVDTVAPDAPDSLHLTSVDRKVEQIDERLYTNDDRVIVWWSADEDESDTFRVVIDGHAYSATERRFHVVEALADGIHWVKVIAIDELGNESAPSAVLWFIVDTKAPEVPGMPTTESPTNNAEPTWTWPGETNPYDDEHEITLGCGFSHYNVYLDGKLVVLDEEDRPITEPTFQCELTDGLHVLEVTSVDLLGNESERSTAGHVLIDTDVPKAPIMKVLPPFTNAATVRFEWTKSSADTDHYEISYTVDGGEEWSAPLEVAGEFYVVGIADVPDGVAVAATVRAYDKAGNKSVWSNELLGAPIASTIVDRTGPVVTLTNPTAAVTTNAAKFKYEWTAVDAGCGVASYTVEFNGSKHQVDETSEDNKYWYEPTLMEGDNTFKVFATDKLGNVGEAKVAPIVKQVKPQIILVQPMPGAEYKINEISTIAFQVIGLIDGVPEVLLNGESLEAWRIVTVVNTPTMAKFYVLLDGDVMVPGTMGIRITVGAGSELFIYTVDSERSGFGFGRLRPW